MTTVSAPPATGGGFAVALRSDGTVWAWGSNSNGQLGDGTTVTKIFPVQVKGIGGSGFLVDVSGIDAGGGEGNSHGLAVQTDGKGDVLLARVLDGRRDQSAAWSE